MVVAPPCSHQNGDACDIDSFRTRAWCRAEVMSCWAMRGADCMYLSAGEGLVPLLAGGEVDRGLLDKRRVDDDDAGVPDFEPGTDGRRHDVPDEARERSRRAFTRQRSTMQSFRHMLPPRSLSSHSTQGEAFRRMPSRSGGSSMRSVGTISTLGSPPRRSSSTASARSARLFLGPRSLGAE